MSLAAAVLALAFHVPAPARQVQADPFPRDPAPRPDAAAFDLLDRFPGVPGDLAGPSPDASIAAGRDSLVAVRNAGIVLIRKPSDSEPEQVLDEQSMRQFLAPVTEPSERITDPVVLFDRELERFFLANAAIGDGPNPPDCVAHIQLAVSRTAFPRSLSADDRHFCALDRTLERTADGEVKTDNQGDFDHIAIVGEKLLIGWHSSDPDQTEFSGRIRVVDVEPLLEGEAPETWTDFVTPERPRPAIIYDVNDRAKQRSRAFFDIQARCRDGKHTWILGAVSGLRRDPRFTVRTVAGSTRPCTSRVNFAPQRGDAPPLWVVHEAAQPVYRDGSLWVVDVLGEDSGDEPVTALR